MRVPGFSLGKVLLLCSLLQLVNGDVTSDLGELQKAFFRWRQVRAPEFSTYIGTKTFNDRLEDLSLKAFDTQLSAVEQFTNAARSIDRTQLSRQHQRSYDVFMDTLNTFKSNFVWRHYGALNPVTFLEGFYLDLGGLVEVTPFDTQQDFDNYIARLVARPRQIDQMIERMEESIRRGTTYHNVSVHDQLGEVLFQRSVPKQISGVINTAPQNSALYRPFSTTLDNLQLSQQGRNDVYRVNIRARGLSALQAIWTALGRLKTFMENTYSRHTRGTYGVGGLPSGGDYYRACLKWHLSVDMSPSDVHQIGLREVDRITQRMRQVMSKQGFNGTVREYYSQLSRDPRFHKSSADEILAYYRNLVFNRIEPKLTQLFKDIPNNTLVVKPLPFDGPYGMYNSGSADGSRPGTFYVNLMRPQDSLTYRMVSLSLHEAVPGHHLQSVYEMASQLPDFLKYIDYSNYYSIPYQFPFYTAYTEGWGLYAEYLGEEMGVYADDYEMMGRFGEEIFRACRLVVDTGMHYFGWSRSKAVKFLSDHTSQPPSEVEIEVDRYLTWPGQACAYKIGELKFRELRLKAEAALSTNFDVRDFHSLLLTSGAVPLSLLETIVDDYIADHTGHSGGGTIG